MGTLVIPLSWGGGDYAGSVTKAQTVEGNSSESDTRHSKTKVDLNIHDIIDYYMITKVIIIFFVMVLLNHYNAFVKDCVYKSLRDNTLDGLQGRTYGTCTLYLQSVTCVIFSDIIWPGLPTISYLCYIFRYHMTWFTYNQLTVLYFQISYDLVYLQSVTCVIFSDIIWPGLPTISYLCYIFRYPMTWFTYNQLPVLYFQISYNLVYLQSVTCVIFSDILWPGYILFLPRGLSSCSGDVWWN